MVIISFVLVLILGIVIFGWFFFDVDIFKGVYNVFGEFNFGVIFSVVVLILWVFIGVELVLVMVGVVENLEKNVVCVILVGVFLVVIVYIVSFFVIMGMVLNLEL